VLVGLPAAMMWGPPAPEPLGPLPPFFLRSAEGEPVGRDELLDQVTVLCFFFTRCPDVCPALSIQMAGLQERLPQRGRLGGRPIRLLSVTVDPEHDQPGLLRDYAARFGAQPGRWRFAHGQRAQVDQLAAGLQLALDRSEEGASPAPQILHSERLTLIGPAGFVHGFYTTDAEGLAALEKDAAALARRG
jgi:protein SCO1/2